MARKPTPKRKSGKGKATTRGPRGWRGRQGPPGLSAPDGHALARLTADLIEAQDALQVQFKRIAQLQAEVDELRAKMDQRG